MRNFYFDFNFSNFFGPECYYLESLHIFDSKLEHIEHVYTVYFLRLEKFTVSNCDLSSLNQAFLDIQTLQYLDASRNNIESINGNHFFR